MTIENPRAVDVDDLDMPRMGVPPELMVRLSMAEQHEYLRTHRRRVNRRGFLGLVGAGALAAGAVGAGSLAAPALAAPRAGAGLDAAGTPFGRHLSWGDDPRRAMSISWQTKAPARRPYVLLGSDAHSLTQKVAAETRHLHTGITLKSVDQYYHHAHVDDLIPGTTYHYVVGHEGHDPIAAGDEPVAFTTAPSKPGDFTFTAFGDQGTTEDAAKNVELIRRIDPRFHIHAGDICYADSVGMGLVGDAFDVTKWDAFFTQNEPVAASTPWMVATGNHDLEAYYSVNGYDGHVARFDFPTTGPDPKNIPSVYSFTYGNVAIISLDSNDNSWEVQANNGYTEGKQVKWLRKELTKLRANPEIDFIVPFHHYCCYSTTEQHASDGYTREVFGRLYDEFEIDLVVQGHNHVYERTDALRRNAVTQKVKVGETAQVSKGTIYVTAGSAGKSLYNFPKGVEDSYAGKITDHKPIDSYYFDEGRTKTSEEIDWSRVRYTGYAVMQIDVKAGDKPSLTCTAKKPDGTVIDTFTVVK